MHFHMAHFSWISKNNARLKLSCKFGESKCNPYWHITLMTSHGMNYVLDEHKDIDQFASFTIPSGKCYIKAILKVWWTKIKSWVIILTSGMFDFNKTNVVWSPIIVQPWYTSCANFWWNTNIKRKFNKEVFNIPRVDHLLLSIVVLLFSWKVHLAYHDFILYTFSFCVPPKFL